LSKPSLPFYWVLELKWQELPGAEVGLTILSVAQAVAE
jgi:hypothetical protein